MGSGFVQSCGASHARVMLRWTSCMMSELAVWCATTVWCVIGRQICTGGRVRVRARSVRVIG